MLALNEMPPAIPVSVIFSLHNLQQSAVLAGGGNKLGAKTGRGYERFLDLAEGRLNNGKA
jgi:hypothetical protein